jgi:hypothetical protein
MFLFRGGSVRAGADCQLLLLAALGIGCYAQSPQKVIDEYLRAAGGAKALAQVQTETITANVADESSGQTGSFSLMSKAPDRFYTEIVIEPRREVRAYNGMSAWGQDSASRQGSEGARTLTGAAAKSAEATAHYWNSRLLDLKKAKIATQFMGIERVGGRPAYRIQMTLEPGVRRQVFFDTETHLIVREIAGPTPEDEQFDYGDYRPVQGIQTPFEIGLRREGRAYRLSVTRAEFNAPLDDSIFDFPRLQQEPLPDIKSLFLEVTRNQKAVEALQKQYTCHVTTEEEQTDGKAQVKSRKIKEYEVFNIAGDEVRHLLAIDGKPLTGDEKKKEDERFNKEFDKETRKEAELARDPKRQEKEEEKDEQQLSDLLRAIRFRNPRRERFRGQDVIAVDFGPNPDYKPTKLMEKIAQRLVGVVWIDDQARDIARLEAHFSDSAKVGGGIVASIDKGSNLVFEQAKVNGEVWLPVYAEVHFAGRVLFLKAKSNQIDRYSDYQKFHAESRIVATDN